MTNRRRRVSRSKQGVGFSAIGIRKLTELLMRGMGVQPHEKRQLQDIFANSIVLTFAATGGVLGVMTLGWLGLFVGPVIGLSLAAWWLESDDFFR